MKQTLLTLFLIGVLSVLHAQVTVSFAPQRADIVAPADAVDVPSQVMLTNETTRTLRLQWRRDLSELPADWQGWVCDPNRCYTAFTAKNPATAPVVLLPGESVPLSAHIRPNEVDGVGAFRIELYEVDRPQRTVAELSFEFTIRPIQRPSAPVSTEIRMYPNPSTGRITLTNDDQVDEIHVYNIIGRKVKSFPRVEGKPYDVRELPEGIYMVSLVSKEFGVLKTIRLSKQMVRP